MDKCRRDRITATLFATNEGRVVTMGTESTGWERNAPDAPAPASAAVPIRRVIGPPPQPGRWATIGINLAASAGWVFAGAMVFGGGLMLWHLLFGDSVGGDVWLGQPAAWVTEEITAADSLPGGEPWTPDMSPPAHRASTTVVVVDAASVPTSTVSTSSSSSTTVAAAPVPQSPSGQANASTPATGTLPSGGSPVTVNTVATATTVPAAASSTTSPSTTVAAATTTIDDGDPSSTTIDDGDESGDDSGRGGGNSGPGGGGDDD